MRNRKDKPLLINLFGGPGSGKSTMAARLFATLKESGYNCELVTEYAKDITWEESHHKLKDQIYIFGKQQHRLWRVKDKVDIIITDSPLLLSLVYGCEETPASFKNLVMNVYDTYDNINVFLNRVKPYNPAGRNQNEEQAKELDEEILECIVQYGYGFDLKVDGKASSLDKIYDLIMETL